MNKVLHDTFCFQATSNILFTLKNMSKWSEREEKARCVLRLKNPFDQCSLDSLNLQMDKNFMKNSFMWWGIALTIHEIFKPYFRWENLMKIIHVPRNCIFSMKISNGFHSLNMQMEKNLMKNSCVKELHILHEISFKRFHSLNLQIGKNNLIRKKNSRVSTEELQSSSARD